NRRWSKDQSSLHKNKNNKKKTVKQLKLRVGLIVFWYLKVSFFPDTLHILTQKIIYFFLILNRASCK
ncbi:MAG: IS5/IS1182 family transposase, partial [Lactobacillus johnsonii]|nr:IS5/IS1182 family transposase [Lactobacillus johnsonii]